MQAIDRLTQFRDASGVQKHVVRRGQARARLACESRISAGLLNRTAIARLQTLYLQRFVRVDHQHAINAFVRAPALHEQGYCHDHVRGLRLRGLAFHLGADQGMEDGIEGLAQG